MTRSELFILDTDHLSLLFRGNPVLAQRLAAVPVAEVSTTIVTAEEMLRGTLNLIHRSHDGNRVRYYDRLVELLRFLGQIRILRLDENAGREYEKLRSARVKAGTQDLKIAAIALANNATLLTRNTVDFTRVPALRLDDWSRS